MRKKFQKFIILLMLFSLNITVFASTLRGYNQVVNIGGTNTENGVKVSKIITESNLENYFDITLTVETENKIEEILKDQDLAIVVVMDISNSMVENYTDEENNQTRLESAQEAGTKMISTFTENSKESDAKRLIGYVAFNSDATKIFDLQECNTDSAKNKLSNLITSNTNQIISSNLADKNGNYSQNGSYSYSYKRYTNIEAGLKLANDMLDDVNVQNKYVIFISDGYPTTYIESNYTGYKNHTPSATTSKEGLFYNNNLKLPCSYGVDYSDIGARKAESLAKKMKNGGITIFSIGTGIDYQQTIEYFLTVHSGKSFSTIDTDTPYYAIGSVNDSEMKEFKNWLKNGIGSGYYYDTNNEEDLINAYNNIFKKIKEINEEERRAKWVANDPINFLKDNNVIEFIGIYDEDTLVNSTNNINNAKYSEEDDTIYWNLKSSNYEEIKKESITTYKYTLKYRIRLCNELEDFEKLSIYNTNGITTLTYVLRTNDGLTDNLTIDFPIPQILGYLGDFTFTKVSNYFKTPLSGAEFKLIHDTDNCPCQDELKYALINDYIKVSSDTGIVNFSDVPSGHIYKLIETKAPNNYKIDENVYKVEINYGNVLINGNKEEDYVLENDIKTSNLKIKKTLKSNSNSSGEFNFKIKLTYDDKPLNNSFKYKKGSEEENISFDKDGTSYIKLSHNEEIIIYDLPFTTSYLIEELDTDGFEVQNCLNDKCENGVYREDKINEKNNVEFINVTSYVLPETGSSLGLILIIIETFLLVSPVIYIAYSNKLEREDK